LVERDNRTVEARGSIPLSSTPVGFRPLTTGTWTFTPTAAVGRSACETSVNEV